MGKTLTVTPAQVAAAKLVVDRYEATGRPVPDAVRKIAEASTHRTAGTHDVVRTVDDRYGMTTSVVHAENEAGADPATAIGSASEGGIYIGQTNEDVLLGELDHDFQIADFAPEKGVVDSIGRLKNKAVFIAELDDDFQDAFKLNQDIVLDRLTTYFLLANSLVIHPAYIWQSDISNRLAIGSARRLLAPPYATLELGKHDSVSSYMRQRISQLTKDGPTPELGAYQRHGSELFDEASDLSLRFRTSIPRNVPAARRDHDFRNLLYSDLDRAGVDDRSMAQILGTLRVEQTGELVTTPLGDELKNFARVGSNHLVSMDTFLARINQSSRPELSHDVKVRRRLLGLYYHTYFDWDTVIPGAGLLEPGAIVNPFEPRVFWPAMSRIAGGRFARLRDAADPMSQQWLRDIWESRHWRAIREFYFDTLGILDTALRSWAEMKVPTGRALWSEHGTALTVALFDIIGESIRTRGHPNAGSDPISNLQNIAEGIASLDFEARRNEFLLAANKIVITLSK